MIRTICLAAALLAAACTRPTDDLEHRLDEALKGRRARIGVAVRTPDGRTIRRGDVPLPLLSVFKVPVALAALDRAARERMPLSAPFDVGPERLDGNTYSPMRDSLPPEGGTVTLAGLIRYSISLSDHLACDRLLDFAGGPAAVEEYLRGAGIGGFRIAASERTMHRATENQRLNTAPPSAVCELFARLLRGGLLPAEYDALLRSALEEAPTGANKLRAGLPGNVRLGHKTGSSDRTAEGMRIADNDAGYVLLPDGRSYCVAVFVTDSRETDGTNAAIAAEISRAAYECFTRNDP